MSVRSSLAAPLCLALLFACGGDEKVAPKQITHLSLPDEQQASISAYHDWWLTVLEKDKAEERG